MLNRYIVERKMPGVGAGSQKDFTNMAEKSNEVLESLSPKIQWIQSFVTDNKVYCEYLAEDEKTIREHAKMAGFPADSVSKVTHVCDPTTANEEFDVLRDPKNTKNTKRENALHS